MSMNVINILKFEIIGIFSYQKTVFVSYKGKMKTDKKLGKIFINSSKNATRGSCKIYEKISKNGNLEAVKRSSGNDY